MNTTKPEAFPLTLRGLELAKEYMNTIPTGEMIACYNSRQIYVEHKTGNMIRNFEICMFTKHGDNWKVVHVIENLVAA